MKSANLIWVALAALLVAALTAENYKAISIGCVVGAVGCIFFGLIGDIKE